jgi:hypothetical protein
MMDGRLGMGLRRVSGWPALPWCIAGGGGAAVWLYIAHLFWLDVAATIGRAPHRSELVGLVLLTGLPFILIGVGAAFVAYTGWRGIRRQLTLSRLVFGVLEIILGMLIWLAAAVTVFWWIGLIAVR